MSRATLTILCLWLASACGGFTTPAQEFTSGLALSAPLLPPRIDGNGKVLVMHRLRLTVAVSAEGHGQLQTLSPPRRIDVDLATRWTELSRSTIPRGDYQRLKLALSAPELDGTFDGQPFHLEDLRASRELSFEASFRVELGKTAAISAVSDPTRWMAKVDGQRVELIAPTDQKASAELLDRLYKSLTAVRDDDHDGVEDVEP